MKIHDLGIAKLNEGPLDALKNFGRAIVDPTDKSGKQEFYKYKTSMQTQFQRWANQTGAGKPDLKDEELICQWLTDQYGVSQQELAQIGLNCSGAKAGTSKEEPKPSKEEPKDTTNLTPSPAPTPAPEETPKPAEETPKPDETKPGEETPKPEEKPAEEPAAAVDFKDPAKFKAEWDKYVAAQNAKNEQNGMGPFKLVTEPQLLSVLKQMWMSTGGTKAESAKPRGNALKESTKSKVTRK